MGKRIIGISLGFEILDRLDEKRGLIPRSTYVEKILCENLGD
jgi:hypothetical protein